jgi:hypothetical protein
MQATTKKIDTGYYKGNFGGYDFTITKNWLNDGSNDMWWFLTINGIDCDPVPTKKSCLKCVEYYAKHGEF